MIYKEKEDAVNCYREEYLEGIMQLIARRQVQVRQERDQFCRDILVKPEYYRKELENMLGWPVGLYDRRRHYAAEAGQGPIRSRVWKVTEEGDMEMYRVQLEVLVGVWFYGILFLHKEKKARPFVLSIHGMQGTPELCSGLLERGTSNYRDMSMRIFERGADVFAPQMMYWNMEKHGKDHERPRTDAALKQTGSSIMAVEQYALRKSIDWLCDEGYADEGCIGVCGLSYGALNTLYLSALDRRVKASLVSCIFADRDKQIRPDWSYENGGKKLYDAELAALIYPRKLWIQVGQMDTAVKLENALFEYKRLQEITKDVQEEWLDFWAFEGGHEFVRDNTQLDAFMKELWSHVRA